MYGSFLMKAKYLVSDDPEGSSPVVPAPNIRYRIDLYTFILGRISSVAALAYSGHQKGIRTTYGLI